MSLNQNGKTYINGIFITEKTFHTEGGDGSIIKLSIPIDTFIEELKEHAENGWINIDIKRRKQTHEKGYTHYAQLNKWKPKEKITNNNEEINPDDIPF